MNHPAGSAIDNQIVDAPDQNSEATGNPDLLSYSRDQHGIDIKIRSSSPAVEQLLADARTANEPELSSAEQAAYDKNYDKGGSYDKIYQTHDKS